MPITRSHKLSQSISLSGKNKLLAKEVSYAHCLQDHREMSFFTKGIRNRRRLLKEVKECRMAFLANPQMNIDPNYSQFRLNIRELSKP